MLAWLCGAALAQDFRAWQGLYEGMLQESAEGDTARAIRWYDGLISGLPEDDPTQGPLHIQLGRTLYMTGDTEAARMQLAIASTHEDVQLRALALVGQIDSLELRIASLPYAEDYSDGETVWLHAWQYGAKGSVTIKPVGAEGDPALNWSTEVSPREDDQILIWMGNQVQPHEFSMRLSAEIFPAYLMVVLIDDQGRWYALNDIAIAEPDSWLSINAHLTDFSLISPEGGGAVGNIHPTHVRAMALRDLSSYYTSDQGPNTVLLDDLSIR